MTLAIGALVVAARLLVAQAPDSVARPISIADSVATQKAARRAQSDFERRRFSLLPTVPSAGSRCDVRVGRYCYWQDDDEAAPPEPKPIAALRTKLLARLGELAARSPTDGWIAGQRVRYLVESGRPDDALVAARQCRADAAWCASLAALALSAGTDVAAADSAVTAALDVMSPEERCAALDIEPLLDGAFRERYHAARCAERDSLRARWLWLARSSYAAAGNEIRVELFARHMMARLASESSSPYGPITGKDLRDLVLRYGWASAWGRTPPGFSIGDVGSAVGFDGARTFALAPTDADLADPSTIGDAPRMRNDPTARARFPIRGVKTLGGLVERVALFRRGDSTLAIAAFDASSDTAMRGVDSARAAIVLVRDERTPPVVVAAVHRPRGVLMASAPWRPAFVAVELRDSGTARGARARTGISGTETDSGRVALSDLLLFAADSTPPTALDSVVARAIVDGRISTGGRLGLFWEMYGLADNERVTATIGLVPDQAGFLRRLAERAGVATPRTPVHLRWEDTPEVRGSVGGRTLVIDLAEVPEGRYTVELTLDVAGQPTRRAASTVEIVSK
ncbi:MAG TPA: hypothetical protein VF761_02020 [Gemmatimonadaceae bacterium]